MYVQNKLWIIFSEFLHYLGDLHGTQMQNVSLIIESKLGKISQLDFGVLQWGCYPKSLREKLKVLDFYHFLIMNANILLFETELLKLLCLSMSRDDDVDTRHGPTWKDTDSFQIYTSHTFYAETDLYHLSPITFLLNRHTWSVLMSIQLFRM